MSAATGALRVVERNVVTYRHAWRTLLSGFAEPVLYLFSLGIGLGGIIGTVTTDAGLEVGYGTFVAPALLATSAMNGAVYHSIHNFFWKLKYAKSYDAMLATPLTVGQVAAGEIGWSLIRGGIYAGLFLVVAVLAGVTTPLRGLLALPAAVFIAWAFASVGMVVTTFMRSYFDFDYVDLATQPMFLFSATFFPLSVYPEGLQWLVQATPLYHAVALERWLMLGETGTHWIGNIAYLAVMGLLGMIGIRRRMSALLLT